APARPLGRELVERLEIGRLSAERGPVVDELERDLTTPEIDLHEPRSILPDASKGELSINAAPRRTNSARPGGLPRPRLFISLLQSPAMDLKEGAAAPKFDLESDAGDHVALKDFAGKWVVLYFYPRDNT